MIESVINRPPSAESSPEILAHQTVQVNNHFSSSTINTSHPQSHPVIKPNIIIQVGNFILGLLYKVFTCFKGLFNPGFSTGAQAIQAINRVEQQVDKVAPKVQPEILISGGLDDRVRKVNFIRMVQKDGYVEVMDIQYANDILIYGGFVQLVKNRIVSMGNDSKTIVAFAPSIALDWSKVVTRIRENNQFPGFKFGKTERWTNEKGENRHALHIVRKETTL